MGTKEPKSISTIAEERGVFILAHGALCLIVAGGTHWFSSRADVVAADHDAPPGTEQTDEEAYLDFCLACEALDPSERRDVADLLDVLQHQNQDVYVAIGGSHQAIGDGVVARS
jgi:hypothetical protein